MASNILIHKHYSIEVQIVASLARKMRTKSVSTTLHASKSHDEENEMIVQNTQTALNWHATLEIGCVEIVTMGEN